MIAYEELLKIFWKSHNPCSRAWSLQYMSILFTHSDEQKEAAERTRAEVEKEQGRVKTPIREAGRFWSAEDYHQKYYLRSTAELMKEFDAMFEDGAAFRDSTAAARVNGYIGGDGTLKQLEKELPKLGLSEAAQKSLRQRVTE